MITPVLQTQQLELRPLPPAGAAVLQDNRETAEQIIGAKLSADWPGPDLLDILPRQAAAAPEEAQHGIWVIIERATNTVIGDVGFFGPPGKEGTVEIGYSIVADRRRRGHATEAAGALVTWIQRQPNVQAVVAGCDETNEASVRTLQRLGFSRTGQTDGQLRWRL